MLWPSHVRFDDGDVPLQVKRSLTSALQWLALNSTTAEWVTNDTSNAIRTTHAPTREQVLLGITTHTPCWGDVVGGGLDTAVCF